MSSFVLKLIALITMFIDHFSYAILIKLSFFNYIGRFAFPIFAFQISEGYIHTKNLKKYFFRLLIFALISQIPFMLFLYFLNADYFCLNIFVTLLLGLTAITCYDKLKNRFFACILVFFIAITAEFIKTDYGAFGIAIIFIFYIFKENKLKMTFFYILAVNINYIYKCVKYGYAIEYVFLAVSTILPIILINLYNNKKGKDTKYFLYLFYPIHFCLLILFMILK